MQLRTQQPVVIIARRVEQGDLRIGALDAQVVALFEVAHGGAITRHLRARLEAIRHPQLNLAPGAHDNGPGR